MSKVRLKITPSLASYLDTQAFDWIVLEKEVGEGATVADLLAGLALDYPTFRERIFDPDLDKVLQQVNIVLNGRMLHFPEVTGAQLHDGDNLILLPVYAGG